ncbi:MAG: aspartate aminotransferase [Nitrospinae bacterium RIFCSPLOWO2_02_FULL_39_110]|nr:MAG: aspartate aminotransferase [Nitrospinae bacterium RIFCSPHIGHO2_02_39_11]OGW01045.1 MAG: aspartate aminotransferase [Nitrospinae bacterium RIFCSPHIGHO2_12_FULL_39_42]OGW02941.1 MAG: aspartate aminotransferase [Nitrospinae bacterium RIFCSPHIGHO2_02_FULL_39_82]OGW07273.1 MAG: aspartate aminotransferase [Nitrospinae bacterium RIFCSPLOWO2_02_FULL_39_110]OGW07841.1 MAG: aspartate aminotransferase [Nitrospinae bacterium RIFCSPLOWO2_12_39_15]OGW12550.1 MAG: aspartate aminotransferase [Nitrospi
MAEESYIQSLFAERLGGRNFGKDTKIYKFEKIKRAKRAAKEKNPEVELIDLGVGEPDEMAFPGVVEKMQEECAKPENRGYADNGIQEFRDAAARYMERIYDVSLDPAKEILHSIGSKPALAMIPAIYINAGDITLMTVPGYPVIATHTRWYGGEVYNLPLKEENRFLPDLDSIPSDIKKRAKLLYINYPNNPTGAVATREFYKKVVEFAKDNNVIVVQDAAYAGLNYNGKPLSFLSISGAKDVGIEIHSLSKAFNMTGWRLAFVAGNPLIVSGFGFVKDNYDSGQFIAIQKSGIYALKHTEITDAICEKYKRRLKMMVDILNSVGFNAAMPGGSFYLYVRAPKGIRGRRRFETAEDFSEYLITEKLISTVPWDDAGHYIRLSATFVAKGEKEEKMVLEEVRRRLAEMKLEF